MYNYYASMRVNVRTHTKHDDDDDLDWSSPNL